MKEQSGSNTAPHQGSAWSPTSSTTWYDM